MRHDEAIKCLDKVLAIDPESTDALGRKAVMLNALDRHDEAIECYDKMLAVDPDNAMVLHIKGITLSNLDRHDEAIECYDKMLAVNPDIADVLYDKGLSLNALERHDEALDCYTKSLAINPDDIDALFNKALTLDLCDRYDEAVSCYDTILAIEPDSVDALHNKGMLLSSNNRHEEAIICYDAALAINPDNIDILFRKGLSLDMIGMYDAEITCYNKILAINPDDTDALVHKGAALFNLDRHAEAIDCYDEVLKIDPDDSAALFERRKAEDFNHLRDHDITAENIREQLTDLGDRCVDLVDTVLLSLGWDVTDTGRVRRKHMPHDNGHGDPQIISEYVLSVDCTPCILVKVAESGSMDDVVKRYCNDTDLIVVVTDGQSWSVIRDGSESVRIQLDKSGEYANLFEHISRHHIAKSIFGPVQDMIQQLSEKFAYSHRGADMTYVIKPIQDTNEAARLFSRYVVQNREKFQNKTDFVEMMRVYRYILSYEYEQDTAIEKTLDSFSGLDEDTKEAIYAVSAARRFTGMAGTLRTDRYDRKYREEFLSLIEAFMAPTQYDMLLERLSAFADTTTYDDDDDDDDNITVIFSALKPDDFMPYTKETLQPLIHEYRVNDIRYRQFNHVYRQIRDNTRQSLLVLDVIANDWYTF